MGIFNKEKQDKKLVGVHIKKEDANRFAMISLDQGIPRTSIYSDILNDYLEKQPSLSKMVENAVNKALLAWKDAERKDQLNKTTFCENMKVDLERHRLDDEIINQIVQEVKNRI